VKNAAAGRLYVVATPIGNLGDLSAGRVRRWKAAALVAAEDTRHSGALLAHLGLKKPLVSLHDHNEAQRAPELIAQLLGGASIALVSDAGTPAISDPGYDLVRLAAEAGHRGRGCSWTLCRGRGALDCGLPTDRFCFEGFLPARGACAQDATGCAEE
jgi:16S rRNA (cytidine1402-2'-O)-methyltransferase